MFSVSREIEFCYGHRLLNYEGKCRHLHGHNGKAVITLEASALDKRGMVFDFAEIGRVVSHWIDEHLDHRVILHRDDPAVPVLQQMGEAVYLLNGNPTAENLAKLIFDFATQQGFPVVEVRVWETPRCFAAYCPPGPHQAVEASEAETSGRHVPGGEVRPTDSPTTPRRPVWPASKEEDQ